jgi:hypothetical protein
MEIYEPLFKIKNQKERLDCVERNMNMTILYELQGIKYSHGRLQRKDNSPKSMKSLICSTGPIVPF